MEEEKVYRQEGFGVSALVAALDVPEYRLRRLINQRLGHRNFSSFVNGYRLAEAMTALVDPAPADVPLLTIALDAGFPPTRPFNPALHVPPPSVRPSSPSALSTGPSRRMPP